ncbi:hypothetical protein [Marinicellulosiphila megalodicopiae]|uniref:hypothetical protein n=1 Tax=Marinicellulosiphila megalodicopiae TaxID=2724896 RepID=UPI003BB1CBC0
MVIDSSFVFPSGVQGNVIGYSNKKVEVNIGSSEGLILGQTLILFYGQNRVGESKVIEVGETSSIASITYLSEKFSPNQILKFQSSIYIVPNAVYLPTNTFIRYFQWSILMLVVGLWLCTFF